MAAGPVTQAVPLALRQATAALDLVQSNPRDAERRALAVLRRSTTQPEARVVALWALGRAQFEQDAPGDARDTLTEAARLAGAHRLADHAAQIRVSLSMCLMATGATSRALRQLALAERALTGVAQARAITQRGLLFARLGRLEDALGEFDRAEQTLRDAEHTRDEHERDELGLARLLNNRGPLLVMLGHLARAEVDLREAGELAERLGQRLLVARTLHNRAFLETRRGDLPKALRLYDAATRDYQSIGDVEAIAPTLGTDRCELLLAGGLIGEAADAAAQAVAVSVRSGNVLAVAEARLLLARAHLSAGEFGAASAQAIEAAGAFKRTGRSSWVALANYVAIQADIVAIQDSRRPPRRLIGQATTIARQLADHGWRVEALHVNTFVGRMAIALGRLDIAEAALATAGDARHRGTADLRVSAWHATALLRFVAGDRPGAKRALLSGLSVLDEHRALLGATELRAHAASHGAELARLGLRLALDEGRPRDILVWAERTRAAALHLPPVRPPDDDELADLLARWRQASQDAREATLDGDDPAGGRHRAQLLEGQIRAKARLAWGAKAAADAACDVAALARRLGDRVLVEYVEFEGELSAVVLSAGRATFRRVGSMTDIANEIDFVRFNHQRLALTVGRGGSAGLAAQRFLDTAALLDHRLVTPLRLPAGRGVIVVPTGVLHAVPWNALSGLHDRDLTISPSAALWCRTRGRPTPPGAERRPADDPRTPGAAHERVALVAGPDLDGGRDEVAALRDVYGRRTRELVDADASVDAVLAACETSDLMHLAAHGDFRADSPMFSSLRLADGLLTVYDLERLRSVPTTMVLPACDAATTDVRAGDELLGTASALLTLGVRSVIAPVAKIPDRATTPLVLAIHAGLRRGLPPSTALAEATAEARARGGPADLAAASALLCIGADDRASTTPGA